MNGKVVNEREEVIIRIGLVIWDPNEEMLREKRGKRLALRVQRNSNYRTILDAALARWKNLQSNLYEDEKEYTILLEDLQEAVFMPGSAKEFFYLRSIQGRVDERFQENNIIFVHC